MACRHIAAIFAFSYAAYLRYARTYFFAAMLIENATLPPRHTPAPAMPPFSIFAITPPRFTLAFATPLMLPLPLLCVMGNFRLRLRCRCRFRFFRHVMMLLRRYYCRCHVDNVGAASVAVARYAAADADVISSNVHVTFVYATLSMSLILAAYC